MKTRIAPTPSGYLHLGNAVNFAVIDRFAREHGAELLLRIDDMDAERARDEYVADIPRVLNWLSIVPSGTVHTDAVDAYRDALLALDTFNCRCSRTSQMCACRDRGYPLVPHESAAKLRVGHGDVVLWRRDDVPAYHLVNVVEDERMKITHVIRGEDLRESSVVHETLAHLLGFAPVTYLHHELVTDESGRKLSKSTLRSGAPMICDEEHLTWVRGRAVELTLS